MGSPPSSGLSVFLGWSWIHSQPSSSPPSSPDPVSDSYLVLLDPMATADDADERADRIRSALIAEGIMLAETSDCVLSGVGHPPGPRLRDLYEPGHGEGYPGEGLLTCGVEFFTEKYVNSFGFVVFEWAKCPACDSMFEYEIVEHFAQAYGTFTQSDEPPMVVCPSCSVASRAQAWTTEPPLGFCYLAVQFWNWPSFESFGWRESVPRMLWRAVGNPMLSGYGRV